MDGYTYMIERNKLMIQKELEREVAGPTAPLPADPDAEAPWRNRLMDLYSELEACGREEWRNSE